MTGLDRPRASIPVVLAAPSEADPRGEALQDERFVPPAPEEAEIHPLCQSDVRGVSERRSFLLGEVIARRLSRPAPSRARASDNKM